MATHLHRLETERPGAVPEPRLRCRRSSLARRERYCAQNAAQSTTDDHSEVELGR